MAVTGVLLLAVTACTGDPPEKTGAGKHRSAVARLGAVPIPKAPRGEPVALAAPDRPAILEMGAPVLVRFGHGVRARLTVLGPEQGTTRPGAESTSGTFTVRVEPKAGIVRVTRADFSSRNESGKSVHLRRHGAASVTVSPHHSASLTVIGRYSSGAAQVTYRHHGRLVAVWDFNIELD